MHQDLILRFLKAISQNKDINPLLVEHSDKLDNTSASELRKFASSTFANQPAKAVGIAKIIVKFSNLIENFQQGNHANNLEIAIAGYESALTVITHEASSQDWAGIQQNLIGVYQQRQDILSKTITELKENTVQAQTQINDLTEHFQQEIKQSKQQVTELQTELGELSQSKNNSALAIDLQPIVSAIQQTKTPSQSFNTVILYDIENLTKGNSNPQFNFSLEDITENIKRYNLVNKIAGQYAYADWSDGRLRRIKPSIQQLGIEPMQIFGFNNHKNAADIQLVIDAVELIHSKPSLEVFAIVSGDGGFSCLAKKLHEYGKIVIGCGYENHSNKLLPAVCDYFVRLPDPAHKIEQSNNCNNAKATVEAQKSKNNYRKVLEYLKNNQPYQSALKEDGVDFSEVNKVFKEQISDFDYKKQGFTQFKKFLNSVIQGTEFKIVKSGSNVKLKIN